MEEPGERCPPGHFRPRQQEQVTTTLPFVTGGTARLSPPLTDARPWRPPRFRQSRGGRTTPHGARNVPSLPFGVVTGREMPGTGGSPSFRKRWDDLTARRHQTRRRSVVNRNGDEAFLGQKRTAGPTPGQGGGPPTAAPAGGAPLRPAPHCPPEGIAFFQLPTRGRHPRCGRHPPALSLGPALPVRPCPRNRAPPDRARPSQSGEGMSSAPAPPRCARPRDAGRGGGPAAAARRRAPPTGSPGCRAAAPPPPSVSQSPALLPVRPGQ